MTKDTVILLCNLTDAMADPWIEAGYRIIMVDPQHAGDTVTGNVTRLSKTIVQAYPEVGAAIRQDRVAFVAGFPPCTDVAVSGARWFESKRAKDPYFQAKAAIVAEQCRTVGELSGAPWFWENPVSVFTNIFGPANEVFHPWQYSGYCADDYYTKTTCLRTGGGMVMPPHNYDVERYARGVEIRAENARRLKAAGGKLLEADLLPNSDYPDDRIHKAGPGEERGNIRSATPRGFAKALFLSNAPHLAAANDNTTKREAA